MAAGEEYFQGSCKATRQARHTFFPPRLVTFFAAYRWCCGHWHQNRVSLAARRMSVQAFKLHYMPQHGPISVIKRMLFYCN